MLNYNELMNIKMLLLILYKIEKPFKLTAAIFCSLSKKKNTAYLTEEMYSY